MKKYPTYNQLNLSQITKDILQSWKEKNTFEKSISTREGKKPWVFYEGPPSANGLPGIHHVMGRTIKDIFCRYKTLQGYQVKRKAGWDTHGLPIELGVEKTLGITKEDIGNKNSSKYISVEDYNKACRKEVMKYTDVWENLTDIMGYWVDMSDPYVTYDNKYIESVWWLLQNLSKKDLLYKGFTIQPYSPAAGTGLSSHELNQPGCYKDVKDRTAVAMFKIDSQQIVKGKDGVSIKHNFGENWSDETYLIAWTTTPWTLPSNTALAVGGDIDYIEVKMTHPFFSERKISVILAKDLVTKVLKYDQLEKWIVEILLGGKSLVIENGVEVDGILTDKNGQKTFVEVKSVDAKKEFVTQLFQSMQKTNINNGILVCSTIGDDVYAFAKAEGEKLKLTLGLKTINEVIKEKEIVFKGHYLAGLQYEQLLPFVKPEGKAFEVIIGDFVTTTDGTGIVHIAPSFGADDFRVAKQNDIDSLTLVDKRGRFVPEIQDGIFLYGEEYVKEAYHTDAEKQIEFEKQKQVLESTGKIKELKAYLSVDERIVLKLQEEGKLFKKETYEHSYPHCWRTDKPILYYPLDSWFIKSTEMKDRMVKLNKEKINWKPEATGTGRFGNWLENLNDWNLSRSRFWGIPIPIWSETFVDERICVGRVSELKEGNTRFGKAIGYLISNKNKLEELRIKGNFNSINETIRRISWEQLETCVSIITDETLKTFDLHKPYIDDVWFIIKESNGVIHERRVFMREPDLIDVWFDSGAMPFAQMHFPFENVKEFANSYPADFIAEGVDQTRGWFFTLHAISAMLKEEIQAELQKHGIEANDEKYPGIAYKNVVSNGLVLDKNGVKMSKRLGNVIDPFVTIEKYGADATRWYMVANAAPWDNLKFDLEGIGEVQRKLFGTLYNTYGFFALYSNVDGFVVDTKNTVPVNNRAELDRWILSKLNSLIADVTEQYENFEPHKAARYIEEFVDEHLSNWYIRLSRRRFWKGEMSEDKKAAYETLHECLMVLSKLMSPVAPFFSDWLFNNLNDNTTEIDSVHISEFPKANVQVIDSSLEKRMEMAQKISSMVLSIRKKENLKVRQPLQKIQIPILDNEFRQHVEAVKDIILAEVNVKELDFVTEAEVQIVKNLKLNFKTLGKKCGKHMKTVQAYANDNGKLIITEIEKNGLFKMNIEGDEIVLETEDVEIIPVDIPGWKVANSGQITVALDITLNDALREEGLARELVNRIQNLRKETGLALTDKILVKIQQNDALDTAIQNNLSYICAETLTGDLQVVRNLTLTTANAVEVDELVSTLISIEKLN